MPTSYPPLPPIHRSNGFFLMKMRRHFRSPKSCPTSYSPPPSASRLSTVQKCMFSRKCNKNSSLCNRVHIVIPPPPQPAYPLFKHMFFLSWKCRHADLLATDISAELCMTYIDRFLMFYIATADRLQRTSAWMEKLDGGTYVTCASIADVPPRSNLEVFPPCRFFFPGMM